MSAESDASESPTNPCTLRELLLYFLRLGSLGFGGPIALVGYMQRDLVDERRWVSKQDFSEGLTLAQLAPGPLAAQLAIYLGWVRAGTWGATLVSIAFILPSFLMVLVLSFFYLRYGGLPWMQGAFYGIGAAVIAIIGRSAFKLVRSTVEKDRVQWPSFFISAAVTAVTETEYVWLFFACGLATLMVKTKWRPRLGTASLVPWPLWLSTGLHNAAPPELLWKVGIYFAQAGACVFGSGLAIVPFLHGGVVHDFHWLSEQQFLDAVAVAMVTPGPVVITVAFIGYLVAGPLGAAVAALGVFLPCYLFVIIPANYFRRAAQSPKVKAFIDGVTAAATGAIVGAAFVLGSRAIYDIATVAIAGATILILAKTRKIPEPLVIVAAGVAGIFLKSFF